MAWLGGGPESRPKTGEARQEPAETISCPKCKQAMREGFLPDMTYGAAGAVSWVEGKPPAGHKPTMRLGFRLTWTSMPRVTVAAYRCSSCGFVEVYAKTPPTA